MKSRTIIIAIALLFLSVVSLAQVIPYGVSTDSILVQEGFYIVIDYYKPLNYDSSTSPMILDGNPLESPYLQPMADRRKALIVFPKQPLNASCEWCSAFTFDSNTGKEYPAPPLFKQVYRHVLSREGRSYTPSYIIGMSSAGQCVTRYMLIRQAIPDSIPIIMAVSCNPYAYVFCIDTFQGSIINYPYGLGTQWWDVSFIDNNSIIKYYNANYGVMIGTYDTSIVTIGGIYDTLEGFTRYERAQRFYAFSDSDAAARGTTLNWKYVEVPGVGHDPGGMYETKASPGDTSSIAETTLFDSYPLGIEKQFTMQDAKCTIFPNPFSDFATIRLMNNEQGIKNYELKMYDLLGREMTRSVILSGAKNLTIHRNNLPAGMYFYKLTDKGKTIATGKIILQ